MNDDQQNFQGQDIDDLIQSSRHGKRIPVAPEESQKKFKEKMKEIEIKEKEKITQEKSFELGVGYIDLHGFPIAPEALILISEDEARRLGAVCFLSSGKEIRIGAVDPGNPEVLSVLTELEKKERAHVDIYLISEHSLAKALKLYEKLPKYKKYVSGVEIAEEDLENFQKNIKKFSDISEAARSIPITQVLSLFIAGAIQSKASDIHIEAEQDDVKIRYRIDGVLHDVASLAHELWPKIINRIKLLAGLKINITALPQDGRFTIHTKKEEIDVRVSTIPTAFGESVVMRLLLSSSVRINLEEIGIRGNAYEEIKREIVRPNGMVLVTGPTGSGKTTTLYAFLHKLNDAESKIITLENPVEYKIKGINQSQIDASHDYSYAKGLRSILRQDPDIVMVGEIRDPETAEIAIQAALTGHLLLSTMHTNSAAGTIPRLLSMAVKPFLLAPALNVIIGQRLVRKLCPECKKEIQISPEDLARVKKALTSLPSNSGYQVDQNKLKFYGSTGCEACSGIGYKGRIGIFEVLVVNEDIEKLILSGQISEYIMQDIAVKQGMVTMVQDGILKALNGITTMEEVFRVTE